MAFFSDPSIELYLGGVGLDWRGAFVPDLCDLNGDPREAMGFICLHNLGLMLVDFFDEKEKGEIYFLTKKGEIHAKAGEIDCSGTATPYSAART